MKTEIGTLKKSCNLNDLQLVRGKLLATGSKEAVMDLKRTLISKIIEPKEQPINYEGCTICFCELSEPYTLQACHHKFCIGCIKFYFSQTLIPMPIKCPNGNCNNEIILRDILFVAQEDALNRIKQQALSEYLKQHEQDVVLCFKTGCPQYLPVRKAKLTEKEEVEQGGYVVTCDQCLENYCIGCSIHMNQPVPQHLNISCGTKQKYSSGSIAQHAKHIRDNLTNTKCPGCKQVYPFVLCTNSLGLL